MDVPANLVQQIADRTVCVAGRCEGLDELGIPAVFDGDHRHADPAEHGLPAKVAPVHALARGFVIQRRRFAWRQFFARITVRRSPSYELL